MPDIPTLSSLASRVLQHQKICELISARTLNELFNHPRFPGINKLFVPMQVRRNKEKRQAKSAFDAPVDLSNWESFMEKQGRRGEDRCKTQS